MKVEFNADGSIKVPELIARKREENENAFQNEACVRIIRIQTSTKTPLTCELTIQASSHLQNPNVIKALFDEAKEEFRHEANLSITKTGDREFVVKIVSGFQRCSWCNQFRNFFREELGIKVINKGSCCEYGVGR